jgi:hypothetical protein
MFPFWTFQQDPNRIQVYWSESTESLNPLTSLYEDSKVGGRTMNIWTYPGRQRRGWWRTCWTAGSPSPGTQKAASPSCIQGIRVRKMTFSFLKGFTIHRKTYKAQQEKCDRTSGLWKKCFMFIKMLIYGILKMNAQSKLYCYILMKK